MALGNLVDDTSEVVKETWDDANATPSGFTFVSLATFEAAYDGPILQGGTWDGTDYTPPAEYTAAVDTTTDTGMVQGAAHNMMNVFDIVLEFIFDNRIVWPEPIRENALLGVHWMAINGARVALNGTRTAANRVKFLEEAASFPAEVTAGIPSYVDLMDTGVAVSKDWSWVDPETDPPSRYPTIMESVSDGFISATNVEDAPATAKLIGRDWINDIP